MKTFTTITLLAAALTFSGCGKGGTVVSGTVKFDDGTPVNFGSVAFDDGKKMFIGTITNGTYVSGLTKTKKIPAGTYRVYLQGTTNREETCGGKTKAARKHSLITKKSPASPRNSPHPKPAA